MKITGEPGEKGRQDAMNLVLYMVKSKSIYSCCTSVTNLFFKIVKSKWIVIKLLTIKPNKDPRTSTSHHIQKQIPGGLKT